MTFLPVILRELQVQARQPATSRMRWIAAAVVMGIWLTLTLLGGRASPEQQALIIFSTVGAVSLIYVLLAGVFQTADCLSEERRQGTLGLLFLTDLHGYDVVLGKLASTSLRCFYTFLAVVPVLSFPFLTGGITPGEFGRVALVLVVTLYLSLSVGLFVSTLSRHAQLAMGTTLLLLVGLSVVGPLVCWLAGVIGWPGKLDALLWAGPPFAYRAAFHDVFATLPGALRFWRCLATLFGIGTAALIGASLLLPHRWRDNPKGIRAGRDPLLGASNRPPPASPARHQLLNRQPFQWLVSRASRPRRVAARGLIILLALWGCGYAGSWLNPSGSPSAVFFILLVLTYGMHLLLKGAVATEVTRQFNDDRQSGALEILLVSPLSVPELLTSQVRGIWRAFRGWAGLLGLLHLALILSATHAAAFQRKDDALGCLILVLSGGILLLIVDGVALVNVGMWMALVQKHHPGAVLATLLRVLLPPWLVGVFLFVLAAGAGGWQALAGPMLFLFLVSFLTDVLLTISTQRKLQRHFRELVALGARDPKTVLTVRQLLHLQPAPA